MQRATSIKSYISELFGVEDLILQRVREEAKREGLPNIHVSPNVGKLLYCLTKIHQPQSILEIGTLAGYSTIWLARALPLGGKLISLELDPLHARIAQKNIAFAGLEKSVEIRVGMASDLLDELIADQDLFDLIFIDADKERYPLYLEKALALSHPGSVILSDNLIPREEKIGAPAPNDQEAQGIYLFNQMIASNPNLESILIPTIVGSQGRIDALGLSFVM